MNQAMRILRKYGADAHLWMPGVGYVNGVTAGNWIDSAGTQAGLVDNPVGLVVDAQATLGPELVTNGDFSDGTTNGVSAAYTQYGSTIANVNSVLRVTSTGSIGQVNVGTAVGANPAKLTVKAGSTYRISISTGNRSGSGTFDIRAGTTNEGAQLYRNTSLGPNASVTLYVVATSPDLYIGLLNGSTAAGGWNEWDNISVRELVGAIPATQTTTANKPILRRGLVNLLTYSQDFTNAAWSKANGSIYTPNQTSAPDGTIAAGKHLAVNGGGSALTQSTNKVSGTVYTSAYIVKPGNVNRCVVGQQYSGVDYSDTVYDMASQTVAALGTGSPTVTSAALGGGWTLITVSIAITGSGSYLTYVGPTGNSQTTNNAAAGDYIYLYSVGLFRGTVTAQQIIDAGGIPLTTTAPASSVAGRNYWEFDGSNDTLALSGPVFQMSDDHCVVVGFNNQKTSGLSSLFSEGDVASASSYYSFRVASTGISVAVRNSDTSSTIGSASLPYALGESAVAATKGSAALIKLRKNGGAWTATTQMPTNVILNSGGIGCLYRNNGAASADFTQGAIYPVIAIKGTVSDADLLILEKFIGQCSGIQI